MQFENVGNGGLYTLDTFFARIFDEMGWEDLPLPASNEEISSHFDLAVLKPFSVFCPRQETIRFGENERVQSTQTSFRRYTLPMWRFPTSTCIGVSSVEPITNSGYANEYGYAPFMGAPDTMLMAMSDIRMAASLGSASSRSLTTKFTKPDVLDLYGGYSGCSYEAILLLSHDISLSTVPDTAFESLYELALLDMKAYFYGKLKRKDGLDTGIGSIQLKVDEWASASEDKKSLLKYWKDEGFNLDIDGVHYF